MKKHRKFLINILDAMQQAQTVGQCGQTSLQRGRSLRVLSLSVALLLLGAVFPAWAADEPLAAGLSANEVSEAILSADEMPPFGYESSLLELIINGHMYTDAELPVRPVLLRDRVYVPLRLVSEGLGYQVLWNPTTREIDIVTAATPLEADANGVQVADDAPIRIFIDDVELVMDEYMGTPYISEEGYTMIPLRVVSEALSCEVEWHDGLVIVEHKISEPPQEVLREESPEEPLQEVLKETLEERWQELSGAELSATPDNEREGETSGEDESAVLGYYGLTIQGDSLLTAEELEEYLRKKEGDVRTMMERNYPDLGFTPFPRDIARLYIEIGARYNIRGDLAFAQALKETGYFQFYGSVQAFQNNFCGLGASGLENTGEESLNGVDPMRVYSIPGLHGLSYLNVADGVEAHIQHLYAYTTSEPLPDGCSLLDPRFNYVKRGVARRWIDLDGRWAVPGNGYGESIIQDYWLPAVPEDENVLARDTRR